MSKYLRDLIAPMQHWFDPAYLRGILDTTEYNDGVSDEVAFVHRRALRPENMKIGRRIVLDHDDVLFNTAETIIQLLNEDRGTDWRVEDIKNWCLVPNIFKDQKEFNAWMMEHPDVFWNQKPLPEAIEFANRVKELAEEYDVPLLYYTSLQQPLDYLAKVATIERFLGLAWANSLVAGLVSKSMIFRPYDVVLDDSSSNLQYARDVGAFPVGIKKPWNSPTSSPAWNGPRYHHDEALVQVEKILKGTF